MNYQEEAYAMEGNLAPFTEMIAELTNRQLDRYLNMVEQGQCSGQPPQ